VDWHFIKPKIEMDIQTKFTQPFLDFAHNHLESKTLKLSMLIFSGLFLIYLGSLIFLAPKSSEPEFLSSLVSLETLKAKPLKPSDKSSLPTKNTNPVEEALAGLHESSSFGLLPIIRANDGMTILEAYRTDFYPLPETVGLISYVVPHYGLSAKKSEAALDIYPSSVTFILSPYAQNPQEWIQKARQKGHEIWLELPVFDGQQNDPGPLGLNASLGLQENENRLLKLLGLATGVTGLVILEPPSFLQNLDVAEHIFAILRSRGVSVIQLSASNSEKEKNLVGEGEAQAEIFFAPFRPISDFKSSRAQKFSVLILPSSLNPVDVQKEISELSAQKIEASPLSAGLKD
jgi:hypothetical protein